MVDVTIRAQLHTRHLCYDGIEHRTLRDNKRIGIVYHRIALIIERYLTGTDGHFTQLLRFFFHIYGWELTIIFPTPQCAQ